MGNIHEDLPWEIYMRRYFPWQVLMTSHGVDISHGMETVHEDLPWEISTPDGVMDPAPGR